MTTPPATRMICRGCGHVVPAEAPYPFRCPAAREGDGVDHVLHRALDPAAIGGEAAAREMFLADEANPFRKFRGLFHSYHTGIARGLSDARYLELVDELDEAVARVDGAGFRATPFVRSAGLAAAVAEAAAGAGSPGGGPATSPSGGSAAPAGDVWIKDETGNVSGSHKARHLAGIMLWLRMAEETGLIPAGGRPSLAIASCGNAALAAAVVARAAGYRLAVYVPPDANEAVVARLLELEAEIVSCPRDGDPGDPCFRRFRAAIVEGALPFTVQGSENGLTVEGGMTLAWEMAAELMREDARLHRLFVQVGGGALATSCAQGFEEAAMLGILERAPRLHAVQTEGAAPLRRAHDRVVSKLLDNLAGAQGQAPADPGERAEFIRAAVPGLFLRKALDHAAAHRGDFMWPWETTPQSIAHGILDDETYDWLAVVESMLRTGGSPLVVSEARLEEANRLARETAGVPADHTGSAGLAGLLELRRAAPPDRPESVAVLLTGAIRG